LKKGIKEAISESAQEIISLLSKLTVDPSVKPERIEDIATRAVKFWLECGSHWARIQVLMSDSTTQEPRRKVSGSEKSKKLVISPTVRRIGNAMGGDLTVQETVSGCDGKFTIMKI
jgi:hypothetical protein